MIQFVTKTKLQTVIGLLTRKKYNGVTLEKKPLQICPKVEAATCISKIVKM